MSMFTLAISCLTTSNLLMDLIFQVPIQYCSLQHQTLLSPPDISTTGHHFIFGPAASFFLELLVIAISSFPRAFASLEVVIPWPCIFSYLYLTNMWVCTVLTVLQFSMHIFWYIVCGSFCVLLSLLNIMVLQLIPVVKSVNFTCDMVFPCIT